MAHQGAASAKALRPDGLPRPVRGGPLGKEMCKPGRPERVLAVQMSPPQHHARLWPGGRARLYIRPGSLASRYNMTL